MKEKISQILNSSKIVLRKCSRPNGAIIASYSRENEQNNYRLVWVRDASYICVAADLLGMAGLQERFFRWCMKAESFATKNVFYENYYIQGCKARERFQPDQTGTLLWAVWHHYKNNPAEALKFKKLIVKSANGICNHWQKDHFRIPTNDLWEERLTFPDLKDNFTYSLAACIKGLQCAQKVIPNKTWKKTEQ